MTIPQTESIRRGSARRLLALALSAWLLGAGFIHLPYRLLLPSAGTLAQSNWLPNLLEQTSPARVGSVVRLSVPQAGWAYPVAQQPSDDPVFVSPESETLTQFRMAADNGVTGILAHNYLAGADFFRVQVGHEIEVTYGDGSARRYRVQVSRRFQALSPKDPRGDLRELTGAGLEVDEASPVLSVGEVFDQIYRGADRVVLQTCIRAFGDASWGRLFVIAAPVTP